MFTISVPSYPLSFLNILYEWEGTTGAGWQNGKRKKGGENGEKKKKERKSVCISFIYSLFLYTVSVLNVLHYGVVVGYRIVPLFSFYTHTHTLLYIHICG